MSKHDITYGEWLAEREREQKRRMRDPLWRAANNIPTVWGLELMKQFSPTVRYLDVNRQMK